MGNDSSQDKQVNQEQTAQPAPDWDRRRSVRLPRYLIISVYCLAAVAMLSWSLSPSFKNIAAVASLSSLRHELAADVSLPPIAIKQKIQQHFRHYGTHIEFQDIVLKTSDAISPNSQVYFTKQTCGDGKVYLYVAFPYRLPILGERVSEWCMRLLK